MQIRVAISGKMRSGKDELAKAIQGQFSENDSFILSHDSSPAIVGFGDPIRELLRKAWVSHGDWAYRELAQNIGAAARSVSPDFWIRYFERNNFTPCIISDVRYLNEYEWCREHSFYMIRLKVDKQTQVWRGAEVDRMWHPSETELDSSDLAWDYVLDASAGMSAQAMADMVVPQIKERFIDSSVQRGGVAEALSTGTAAEWREGEAT